MAACFIIFHILEVFIPDMEDVVFVLQVLAPMSTVVDLALSTSLLFALFFYVLRQSYHINILQLDNMCLAMEIDQLIKDLKVVVALGEQQLREARELEDVWEADTAHFRVG